jgi:hypothetical protein
LIELSEELQIIGLEEEDEQDAALLSNGHSSSLISNIRNNVK